MGGVSFVGPLPSHPPRHPTNLPGILPSAEPPRTILGIRRLQVVPTIEEHLRQVLDEEEEFKEEDGGEI